jgi:hypothetical protein
LLSTIAVTTICWVAAAYLGPQTDRKTLIEFYRKIRPAGPGWEVIRREAEAIDKLPEPSHDNIPLAIIGWVLGCTVIWSALFALGNFLYQRWGYATGLTIVFAISGTGLLMVIHKLWSTPSEWTAVETSPPGRPPRNLLNTR